MPSSRDAYQSEAFQVNEERGFSQFLSARGSFLFPPAEEA